ncbi:MAG: metallophosphoesterase, partial [Clostridiales bacterium]|nr:metallophosphoesterase [Clostridiales bacterium]
MRLINKERHIIRNLIRVLIIAFFVIVAIDNIVIHTTVTEVSINDLPASFEGYRIVQVSDLHNNVYGIGQSYLISCIKAADPDIIVITGDLIDRNTKNVNNAMLFVNKAVEIAPVFYVSGNHEATLPEEYAELVKRMEEAGVSVLNNE